jgi:hypothetical protein
VILIKTGAACAFHACFSNINISKTFSLQAQAAPFFETPTVQPPRPDQRPRSAKQFAVRAQALEDDDLHALALSANPSVPPDNPRP